MQETPLKIESKPICCGAKRSQLSWLGLEQTQVENSRFIKVLTEK